MDLEGVQQNSRLAVFGVFELDLRTGELRKSGIRIRLQSQPFVVLSMLLEKPGELVEREEFQRRLWPDGSFVDFEDGLTTAVKKVRTYIYSLSHAETPYLEKAAEHGVWQLTKEAYEILGKTPPSVPEQEAPVSLARFRRVKGESGGEEVTN